MNNKEQRIEQLKSNLNIIADDDIILNRFAELMSQQVKDKEPEEGQVVNYLGLGGNIYTINYFHEYHFFAWRTKQIFFTEKEIECYKRFLLIEAQIREIAERINDDKLKHYLKNICEFEFFLENATNFSGVDKEKDYCFWRSIKSEISAEDLKFYFEYER